MSDELLKRVEALELQITNLNDIERIRSLRFKYHECFNEGKFSDIPGMFTTDGVVDFGYLGKAKGTAKIVELFATVPSMLTFVKQFIHNHVVNVNGNNANGFCYLEAKTISKDTCYIVAARYDDIYKKENNQWKFSKIVLTPFFTVPYNESWAQNNNLKMGH